MNEKNNNSVNTELEVKFNVPDRSSFDSLRKIRQLGDFQIEPIGTQMITDRYLDVADQRILRAGFVCRIRLVNHKQILSLKSLTPPEDNIHRRQEIEMEIESEQTKYWPEGKAKNLLLQLAGEAPLQSLFTLQQVRHKYLALLGDTPVIEVSLDEVSHDYQDYLELEAEMLEAGTESDLRRFAELLQSEWNLQTENLSKFERAFAGYINRKKTRSPIFELSDSEKSALEKIANSDNEIMAKRAMIVLMSYNSDVDPSNIAKEVELTARTVKQWQKKFSEKRLAIFPSSVVSTVFTAGAAAQQAGVEPAVTKTGKAKKRKKVKSKKKSTVVYKQKKIGLKPTDSLAEVGRKVLGFHFAKMLKHEPGTRRGTNIEELHSMRVATRRMRAAFKVFGQHFLKKAIKPLLAGLKETGNALGPVRDLDVFIVRLQAFQNELPKSEQEGIQPLLNILQARRDLARDKMLTFLDSPLYLKFRLDFLEFVSTEGLGARPIPTELPPTPYQLRHVVPSLIYTYYEEVRAYETTLDNAPIETLHQLRISFKGLRYTLEFLREVLGAEKAMLIKEIKAMQDYLGDLNDADVASTMLREFIGDWDDHQGHLPLSERHSPAQIVNYFNANLDKRHQLLVSFPDVWNNFNRLEIRQNLAQAISVL